MTTKNKYIDQVIEHYSDEGITRRNGVQKLAEKFNRNIQTIYQWKRKGRIPHEYTILISEETGIKRYNLNQIGYYPGE